MNIQADTTVTRGVVIASVDFMSVVSVKQACLVHACIRTCFVLSLMREAVTVCPIRWDHKSGKLYRVAVQCSVRVTAAFLVASL